MTKLRTFRLLAFSGSVVLALGITEIGLRVFNYRPGTMDPKMYAQNHNDLLPYKLQRDYAGYCAGREVSIDAYGNRKVRPSYSELQAGQNASPVRTILLLGDSGVFGYGLSDQQTIASQLQSEYFKRHLNCAVENIGVCGYTSWNEYASLVDYLGSRTATDVILLYMPNDLTFDNDYFGIGRGNYAAFSRDEDRIHRFTRFLYSHLYVTYLISDSMKRLPSLFRRQAAGIAFDEDKNKPEIDYSMAALQKIQDTCNAKNIKFYVAIYRDVAYYDDATNWIRYEKAIEQNLNRLGIKWFLAKSHIDNLKASEVRVTWNDPHPSARAVGFIVSDLLNELQ